MPFRGNAASLESLYISICAKSVTALTKHRVFTPASHPRLNSVKIRLKHRLLSTHFDSDDECMRFILGIGPDAAVRNIYSIDPEQSLATALPPFYDCVCIQVPELPNTEICFWDAVELVKSLPILSDLHTLNLSMGPIPAGTTLNKLPEYVLSNYASISRRFRCWRLSTGKRSCYQEAARCALLMALICPSLDLVIPSFDMREPFVAEMERLIVSKGFNQYKQRLQRLLGDM
ncbi:hypothetical protein IWW38_000508 [Coemansia aciculifera]|uniref:Uncharacterized protein n=1 Tax=Coemansia aciculifera TaxID=417176 RepID=A0ACC1M8X1_9FUNG|nr:hypothetical protein IWW38_000508 [Coemansia aciculifera]